MLPLYGQLRIDAYECKKIVLNRFNFLVARLRYTGTKSMQNASDFNFNIASNVLFLLHLL